MRKLLLILILSTCFFGSGYANYEDGVNAYNNKDYATALEEFKLAAEQGDSKSQYRLGLMHYSGDVKIYDFETAFQWILKAAEKGHRESQHRIGFMYQYGEGILKDYKKSAKWFKKSADQNYAPAQRNLALLYIYGEGGISKDMPKAKFLTLKAYENPESSSKIKKQAKNQWDTFKLWEY